MDNDPPSRMGTWAPAHLSPADEARLFEDIIRAHPNLPEGVHQVDYRLGWDDVGSPAIWFVLKTKGDLRPSRAKIIAINDFGNELIMAALTSDSERVGYIDIQTE